VARTGDAGLVAGRPIFLSLRAVVRAHVQARSGQDFQAHLAYAQARLHPPPATAMAVGGLPGTGKSTLARAIAPDLGPSPGALVLRSDEIRKRRFGVAPEQALPPDAYAETVSRAVMAQLFADFCTIAAAGHAVIADATFLNPADRQAVRDAADTTPFHGIWLEAPMDILESRIGTRTGDASDADTAVLRNAARADPGAITWTRLDATDSARLADFVETVTNTAPAC
jgi:predicted kinase